MDYSIRFQQLAEQFRIGRDQQFEDTDLIVRFFTYQSNNIAADFVLNRVDTTVVNDFVEENEQFEYPVFIHSKTMKYKEVIVLLHGLNERSWTKYLPWAEYLCRETGKAVLLFPIAYHVNRSPVTWSNPRFLQKIIDVRRKLNGHDRSLSFANVALSERLSDNPYRFYNSGRQSYFDIVRLISEIKRGKHPLFAKDTKVDIFAYSIGAFLSQILILTNPNELFSDSRLFMFCGGSIFNAMYGESRSIMDKKSFERLLEYYQTGFWAEKIALHTGDDVMKAFYSMIASDNAKDTRLEVFRQMKQRLGGVSLALDKVIPYSGVVAALGHDCASRNITLLDLPYEYTHENPFPVNAGHNQQEVNDSFVRVFEQAAGFLGN
ncbi:MAG: DUF6051 family protein [Paludibacter sp.]|nr:DUF6051 family protein [Paludibacter sp.]